jgi:DNA-binding MarR family transcriptional regulator
MSGSSDFTSKELGELATDLRTLWHALINGLTQSGRADGLQRQQFWVIGALSDGPLRMSDLAERTGTSQASLTGIVDRLEERGLIERTRNSDDRRVVEVDLTSSGRSELKMAHERMLDRLAAVLAPLSAQDRRELGRILRDIGASAQPDDEERRCCN